MVYLFLILAVLCAFLWMIGFIYTLRYLFIEKVFKQNFFIGVAVLFALSVGFSVFAIMIAAAASPAAPAAAATAVILLF